MEIKSLRAIGLGVALSLFFFSPAGGAPDRPRPPQLDGIQNGPLVTSTVIKVLEVWPHSSLKIKTSSPLQLELWPEGGKLSRKATLTSSSLSVQLLAGGLEVGAADKAVRTDKISLTGLGMKVGDVSWPRRVDILRAASGKLWVIYHVNIESYVAKVLPHEMSLSWPEEALKAQAIAIRTYAAYQMERYRSRPFHVHSTTQDQVFKMEPVKSPWAAKLKRVMAATKGQVLTEASGKVASIFYHADCGGSVERTPWVWNDHLSSSTPIQCAQHPHLNWRLEVKDEELAKKLSGSRQLGSIDGVRALKTSPSGRVEELGIVVNSDVAMNMRPEELRKVLGPNRLKSARFTVRALEDGVEFLGHGYGHGVGLCQRGSRAWAQQGKMSSEILKIYYPSLSLGNTSPLFTAQRGKAL